MISKSIMVKQRITITADSEEGIKKAMDDIRNKKVRLSIKYRRIKEGVEMTTRGFPDPYLERLQISLGGKNLTD
jgi:hypothetical protein